MLVIVVRYLNLYWESNTLLIKIIILMIPNWLSIYTLLVSISIELVNECKIYNRESAAYILNV